MSSLRLRSVPSQSGQINVEVDGVPYHSPYNPQREAEKFYRSYPIEKADVILHFGWGLGNCGEILRDRMKASARVIVFAYLSPMPSFSSSHGPNSITMLCFETLGFSSSSDLGCVSFSTNGPSMGVKKLTNFYGWFGQVLTAPTAKWRLR